MPVYVPNSWVNDSTPALNATNLNKISDELKLQANAVQPIIVNSLPTWANGVAPAVSEAAPLNEMERVCQLVAQAMSLSYTPTAWGTGWTPARNATRLNHLDTQVQANRTALDAVPAGNPYTAISYANGLFNPPWATIFYNGSLSGPGVGAGFVDLTQSGPIAAGPDGRASVVNDPAGGGFKVARFEIRDSDPAWPTDTSVQKSEVRFGNGQAMWNKATVAVGDIRWFSLQLYCPWNVTEKFEVAQGSNDWNVYCDVHSTGPTISPWSLGPWGTPTNQRMYIRVDGGTYGGGGNTVNYEEVNLWNVTDSGGAPILANHNRWIKIVCGMRMAADSTGWLEVWVDGVNVYPRKNRPTMWTSDIGTGMYLKHGLYNALTGGNYPITGRSVLYHGAAKIGLAKSDVD